MQQEKLNIQKRMNKKKIFRPCGNCTACQREKCEKCKFCQKPNQKKRCVLKKCQNQNDQKKLEKPMTKIKRKSNERSGEFKITSKGKVLACKACDDCLKLNCSECSPCKDPKLKKRCKTKVCKKREALK